MRRSAFVASISCIGLSALTGFDGDACMGARSGPHEPDVDRIVYSAPAARLGSFEVRIVRTDVTSAPRMLPLPFRPRFPTWSPLGTQLAVYNEDDHSIEIFDVSVDDRTSAMRRIASDLEPSEINKRLAWSPRGLIAYHQHGLIADGSGAIYTVDAAGALGQSPSLRVGGPGQPNADNPTFCHDGRMLFDATDASGSRIMMVDADFANLTQVIDGSDPDCADRQLMIVFVRDHSIFLRDLSTGAERLVIDNASRPVFGPDGDEIAFVRDGRIFVSDLNGFDVHPITTGPEELDLDWVRLPGSS